MQEHILKEIGTIVREEPGYVWVQTQRQTGCSGCSSESGCGTSALAKLFTRGEAKPLKVEKTESCKVGDQVELHLDESRLLKHSFMAYGMPLIGLFSVAIGLSQIVEKLYGASGSVVELSAILGGMIGLLLGWKFTQKFYQPVLPTIGSVLKTSATDLT